MPNRNDHILFEFKYVKYTKQLNPEKQSRLVFDRAKAEGWVVTT